MFIIDKIPIIIHSTQRSGGTYLIKENANFAFPTRQIITQPLTVSEEFLAQNIRVLKKQVQLYNSISIIQTHRQNWKNDISSLTNIMSEELVLVSYVLCSLSFPQ